MIISVNGRPGPKRVQAFQSRIRSYNTEGVRIADLEQLTKLMKSNRVKWGFIWIILASLLWGFSYVPQEAIWSIEPLGTLWYNGGADLLEATIVLASMQSLMFTIVLFLLWSCVNNKPREAFRNLVHWPISKWFLVSAFFGGLMAMFGSTLATAFVGADFAAAIALLSSVFGAIYARVLFKEILTKKMILGIIVLVVGGILVLDPQAMVNNIMSPEGKDGVWLGYVGGILSAIGWGIESCYNVRGLDVADTEATTPVRYFWEFILWMVIIFPITGAIVGVDTFYGIVIDCVTTPEIFGMLVFTALSLGVADSLLHKGYPLMGVGRGLAINSGIYVPASLVALWVFLKDYSISLWLLVGTVVAIIGVFIMYWETDEEQDSVREIEA